MKTIKKEHLTYWKDLNGKTVGVSLVFSSEEEMDEALESYAKERAIGFIGDIVQHKSCTVFRDGDVKAVYEAWIKNK